MFRISSAIVLIFGDRPSARLATRKPNVSAQFGKLWSFRPGKNFSLLLFAFHRRQSKILGNILPMKVFALALSREKWALWLSSP